MTSEFAFIAALRDIATHPAARGLNDDCAVLDLGHETLIITHDAMAAGVHFLPDQDPADVAWKLVATNLSDLAAKGAQPLGVVLGYALNGQEQRFTHGLREVLDHYQVPLLGGDTIAVKGTQVLGLTAIGKATHRPVPARSGAKAGDAVYISGPVGAAMLGLEALQKGRGDSLAYRRPQALLAQGQALAPLVSAMMDVSDGLLLDCYRMAEASGVTLALHGPSVPLACPENRRDEALRWGDDYQLLFTAPPETQLPPYAVQIGTVLPSAETPLILDGVNMLDTAQLGFSHSMR